MVQPPLYDQQIDYPAHPARDPDRLTQRSRIDLCACIDLRHKDREGDSRPSSVGDDREGQCNAAQHPLPVIGVTALPDRSKAGQRCAEPEQREHGVRHPLIGTIQAHRRDDHDTHRCRQCSSNVDSPAPAMNGRMRLAKPWPDLQAGGKQRRRTKEDVTDQQRIVAGVRWHRLDPGMRRVQGQIRRHGVRNEDNREQCQRYNPGTLE